MKTLDQYINETLKFSQREYINEGWQEVKEKTELAQKVCDAVEKELTSHGSRIKIDKRENYKSSITEEKYLGQILHFTLQEKNSDKEKKYEFGFLTRYDEFVLSDITNDKLSCVLFIKTNKTFEKILKDIKDWVDKKLFGGSVY